MKKSNKEILSVLSREIHNSSGYIGGELVARRKKSLEYYPLLYYPFYVFSLYNYY